ncbi:MAG: alpha/beta fold hydrolase, partial [Armatimonadetes bacterium]|nr:alpha/beta fold hydrolase [Armatimonadota bacterium]
AMDLLVADEQGAITRLSAGDGWSEGAVEGIAWTWRTPWQFPKSVLLAGSLAPLGHDLRVYGLLTSVGEGYQAYLDRLAGLRERMMAAATAPGATPRLRRHLGSVLINLEDKGQSQAGWATWMARDDLERLNDEIDELEAQFRAAEAGRDPLGGKKGTYLRGYVSEMDDTLQHYSVAVPDAWSPTARLPLLISLHGYGFGRFLGHPAPSYPDAVAVACFGRGNGDYKLWCEQDILTVLDAMLEDYGVDPDRVYITGGSMGGTGSWHMATMYPDRFAAIGPTAGNANHHVWEEVWGWGQREPTFMTPFRDWLESTTSAFQYADNLRHVGVYCLHGTLDNICPVGHARTMVERLRNLSYDVVYEEFPEVGHGGFPGAAAARQKNYLFSRARDPYPRQVTWRTSWHRYPGAYWVAVERFGRQGQDARIDARVDGQQIAVTTVNVQRLRLDLSDRLLDRAAPVDVTVDGLPAYQGPVPSDGALRLGRVGEGWQAVARPAGREKNPTVGGPLEHAFMSRFLLVCGTAGDRRENEVNRRMTEQLAEKWRRWGREQRARVKMDWEVTEQDIAESNLICFGGPASNRFVRRINDRLPIRLTPEGVVAGQELFAGQDVGVKLCYPNPLNPDRYVCVFGGVSWEGTYDINGRFGNWFDWGVFDDRNWFDFSIFDAHTQSPETHLMVGYFDQDWRLDEAVVFRGDAALRRLTRPRRPPDPLAALPDGDEVYLSEITPLRITMEKGVLGYDQSFAGNPITLGSMVFDRGLGVHPQAEVVYDIGGQFAAFEAWVGVDLEGASSVSKAREEAERVAFQLYGDGQLLADTGEMRWNTPPRRIVANVEGVKQLTLMARALDGRKWLFGDASWGLARLSRARPARVAAPVVPIAADRLQLDGAWLLEDYAVGEGVARGAERPQAELATERRIHLPGSIPVALAAAGELPEPYRNDHLRQVAELAKREWWLYRWFDVPTAWQGRRLQLTLSGVTQQAEAWVNGDYVGRASGPFSATTLEVGGPTRFGQRNLLAIRLLAGSAPWTNVRSFAVPARETQVARGTDYGLDGGGLAPALGLGEVTL